MTQTPIKQLTFEEYLTCNDGTEKSYELVAGKLVEMPPESNLNVTIAIRLLLAFAKLVSEELLRHKDTEIVISRASATVRLPDLIVLTKELADSLQGATRSTIMLDMPPPALVVEVVSPGKVNQDRDYRYQRSEYAARGIQESWIVDPINKKVTVLVLKDGLYEESVFTGNSSIVSPTFPGLRITAETVLTGK